MYIFGGKNEDSEKLNDLWCFNIADQTWKQITPKNQDNIPNPRSGHSCDIFDGYLVIYGGIFDVTKELNDLYIYSIARNEWFCL